MASVTAPRRSGNELVMNLGYSHQVIVPEIDRAYHRGPPTQNKVVIHGADKQKVGQFAARSPEEASSRAL